MRVLCFVNYVCLDPTTYSPTRNAFQGIHFLLHVLPPWLLDIDILDNICLRRMSFKNVFGNKSKMITASVTVSKMWNLHENTKVHKNKKDLHKPHRSTQQSRPEDKMIGLLNKF